MKRALIIGAGATGRGFLAPLLSDAGFDIDFIDSNRDLLALFAGRHEYQTAFVQSGRYCLRHVRYRAVFTPAGAPDPAAYDATFTAVGPESCLSLADMLCRAPLGFLLENDAALPAVMRESARNPRIHFGIPDVITSNTAPSELLALDPLCVVSESGTLVLEQVANSPISGEGIVSAAPGELKAHWLCKFYIHNASHAALAYLGAARGHEYMHEAMVDPQIEAPVLQAMRSLSTALVHCGMVEQEQAASYLTTEESRFRNPLLFDPIRRVARDPLRKLAASGRLVQALNLLLKCGLDTEPVTRSIAAAIHYRGEFPSDRRFNDYVARHSPAGILKSVCGIADEELIRKILA